MIPKVDMDLIDKNFVNGLTKMETKDTIENQIFSTAYLSSFLFRFNELLYNEYLTRSKYGNDFFNERTRYAKNKSIS